jgi:hypothetical protein
MEYKATFNLASAAGQLITTIDKTNPNRGASRLPGGSSWYRPAVSPRRALTAVNVKFSGAATQTFTVSIVDRDGVALNIFVSDLVAATQAFFEPDHEMYIGPKENFQVDVTATGAPAITGTITVLTVEA